MIHARYLFRIDDITPTMHWGRFWGVLSLLRRNRVRPLLGIVPDNHDPALEREPARADFWETMRQLRDEGLVELSQHGYQHTLMARPGLQLIGSRYGVNEVSEFAGRTFSEQVRAIDAGARILDSHGLLTPYFMAPNHSFDCYTLRALKACGFRAITDGIALFPFRHEEIICIPQQAWRPRRMPCGVITICLHTNETDAFATKRIREFLRTGIRTTSFGDEVARFAPNPLYSAANAAFCGFAAGAHAIRGWMRTAAQKTQRGAPQGRTPQSCLSPLPPSHPGSSLPPRLGSAPYRDQVSNSSCAPDGVCAGQDA